VPGPRRPQNSTGLAGKRLRHWQDLLRAAHGCRCPQGMSRLIHCVWVPQRPRIARLSRGVWEPHRKSKDSAEQVGPTPGKRKERKGKPSLQAWLELDLQTEESVLDASSSQSKRHHSAEESKVQELGSAAPSKRAARHGPEANKPAPGQTEGQAVVLKGGGGTPSVEKKALLMVGGGTPGEGKKCIICNLHYLHFFAFLALQKK
jgi:hypothetical protein